MTLEERADSLWKEISTKREADIADARARFHEDMARIEREFAASLGERVVEELVRARDQREVPPNV